MFNEKTNKVLENMAVVLLVGAVTCKVLANPQLANRLVASTITE